MTAEKVITEKMKSYRRVNELAKTTKRVFQGYKNPRPRDFRQLEDIYQEY
jgi:hypothetical protein